MFSDLILVNLCFLLSMFLRLDNFNFMNSFETIILVSLMSPISVFIFYKLKFYNSIIRFISNKIINEENDLNQDAEKLEKFIEETFDPNNIDNLKDQLEQNSITGAEFNAIDENFIKTDIKNKKSNNDRKILIDKPQHKNTIPKKKKSNQRKTNKLILPSRSIISTSEFKVQPRGYVKLSGPNISLNLKRADIFDVQQIVNAADSNEDYSTRFIFDNGQRTTHYDTGRLILKQGQSAPAGNIFVKYRFFFLNFFY